MTGRWHPLPDLNVDERTISTSKRLLGRTQAIDLDGEFD
jgi:hypothetical protein